MVMDRRDCDVIVIGAGVAGLQAGRDLVGAGKKVMIVEARDRIGGRIHTLHERDWPVPVELGAEFVHGRPPELWPVLERANVVPYECADEHWHFHDRRLERQENFW